MNDDEFSKYLPLLASLSFTYIIKNYNLARPLINSHNPKPQLIRDEDGDLVEDPNQVAPTNPLIIPSHRGHPCFENGGHNFQPVMVHKDLKMFRWEGELQEFEQYIETDFCKYLIHQIFGNSQFYERSVFIAKLSDRRSEILRPEGVREIIYNKWKDIN